MAPKLGVLLSAEFSLAELADLGKLSEDLGYDYFWYVDTRFHPECYLGLAAVAAKTSKILLGTGVTDPFTRHPAITAVTIDTLNEMSNGRAILGLGAGGWTIRKLGLDWKLPVAALRECVEIVRGLLRGEYYKDYQGKVISLQDGKLAYKPYSTEIPIYFATHGAQVSKLAGRVADGALLANTVEPSELMPLVEQIYAGLEESGRPRSAFDVCVRVEAAVDDDEDAAFQVMKGRVVQRLIAEYPAWDFLARRGITLPDAFVEHAKRKGPPKEAEDLLPNEVVGSLVLAGNARRVAEHLAAAMIPEVTQICIRPWITKGQSYAEAIEKFIKEVIPAAQEIAERRKAGASA